MNFLLDWFEFLWAGLRKFIFGKHIESSPKPEILPKPESEIELLPKPEIFPKPESEIELLPKNELISETVELLPLELENGEGKDQIYFRNTIYTDEQQKRKIKCITNGDKNFEVPWYLMMQSKIFSDMWTNLDQEKGENSEPFAFHLPTISEKCFRRIVDWMRHRHGQLEFELKFGKETGQQIWFQPDEWENQFGFGGGKNKMNLETVKELYLAANFLDLPSLFHYCVQEFSFAIIQVKKMEKVRQILCLVDDLTPEEKAEIHREFDIPILTEKKPNFGEREPEIVGIKNPLPPELVHPIFAKLSLSDQRWLLTLNRDAYKYLADRVRKNWPKWMDKLKVFIIEENPKFFGHAHVYIPQLEANLPPVQWNASHILANRALQTEMLLAQTFVDQKFDSITAEPIDGLSDFGKERVRRDCLKSAILQAIKHMDGLFGAERQFQRQLEVISKRYEQVTSMNSYKRGVLHLMEERRQILEELEANGMQELKKKLAESENWISEYWVQGL